MIPTNTGSERLRSGHAQADKRTGAPRRARLAAGALAALCLLGVWRMGGAARPGETSPPLDVSRLDREHFYSVLVPLAKAEGRLTMYNFDGDFGPIWRKGLIEPFTKKYGVEVTLLDVKSGQAEQQLKAARRLGAPAPVDVFFESGGDYARLADAKLVAGFDLAALLPNLAEVPAAFKSRALGVETHGTYPIVQRNQTALAYDSAGIAPADVPRTFDDLLLWSQTHPHRFALTAPERGGSGSGFLYSLALARADASCAGPLRDPAMSQSDADAWAMAAPCLAPVWAYMLRLLDSAELTNGNTDTLNLINNGRAILGTVWEDQAVKFIHDRQLPPSLRLTLLEDGQIGSGDALFIPAGAAHPAAALLLIDMAFGKEFQAYKLAVRASRSPRPDIAIPASLQATMLPADLYPARSRPANWTMANALSRAFEELVLSRR